MRYRAIVATLTARTAIHVGTGEGLDVTDDLCRRNAAGEYIIPGTAIGGALRAIATRLAPRLGSPACRALWSEEALRELPDSQRNQPCRCWACHLFGDVNPSEGNDEETGGRASRLFVAHAAAAIPAEKVPRIRDGVGIDRTARTSARAASVKFDLEVLPAGTTFALRMELDDASENDEQVLAAALAEWQAGRAWLGGRVARGLGAFDLADLQFVERELGSADTLMTFLKSDTPWKEATASDSLSRRLNEARSLIQDCAEEGVARSFCTIQFSLNVDGPFLINDTMAAVQSGFDHVPLLDIVSTTGRPVLPGASLRGGIRSQAEKIARTLATLESADGSEFLRKCPACDPVESRENEPLANCDTLLRKVARVPDEQEVVAEQLCLACRLFGSTRRGSRLIVEDAVAAQDVPRKVLDFLAIDRYTGGGKEGAKFDALALWRPSCSGRLHLDNPAPWELGWIWLVLRDLAGGLLPVGFGAAKGFGRASVDAQTVHIGFISDADFPAAGIANLPARPVVSGVYQVLTWQERDSAQHEHSLSLAQEWVDQFHRVRREFSRSDEVGAPCLPCLRRDSFFGAPAEQLYGRAVKI